VLYAAVVVDYSEFSRTRERRLDTTGQLQDNAGQPQHTTGHQRICLYLSIKLVQIDGNWTFRSQVPRPLAPRSESSSCNFRSWELSLLGTFTP